VKLVLAFTDPDDAGRTGPAAHADG